MGALVFRRYGGSLQVQIEDFDDLCAAVKLPPALWVATACPTTGLVMDPKFLTLLDADNNGRIRSEELREAVDWCAERLEDTKGCDEGSDTLVLERLSKAAAPLRSAAELVLRYLDVEKKSSLTLEQLRNCEKPLRDKGLNGDGIVAPETIKDEALAALAKTVLECLAGKSNRAGKTGYDKALLEEFRKARGDGIARLDKRDAVLCWGDASMARAKILEDARPRLEEYFLQCRLVAAQPDSAGKLRLPDDKLGGTLGDAAALARAATALPVAPPNAAGALRWSELVRGPQFESLDTARRELFEPVLGVKDALTEADFRDVAARAKTILEWYGQLDKDKVAALEGKLKDMTDAQFDALAALCDADLAEKEKLDRIDELEKLLLLQQWLLRFANNFIAMPDLYNPKKSALFEQGKLTLAGRFFAFSVLVTDRDAHAALSGTNTMFIAYVRVEGAGKPAFEVAVPVTSGDAAGVVVGKRGVFTDPAGTQYDATVTQIVRNPVSLWEAATAPFVRIRDAVGARVSSFVESGDKAMEAMVTRANTAAGAAAERGTTAASATTAAATATAEREQTQAAQASAGQLAGSVAAIGIALAAVGSTVGFLASTGRELGFLGIVKVLLGLSALIMIPSGFGGWLKLRKRNLAVVLEGSGWALNDRLLLGQLGRLFTRKPPLPEGSKVDLVDPTSSLLAEFPDDDKRGSPAFWFLFLSLFTLGVVLWWYRAPINEFLAPSPVTAPHRGAAP